MNLMIKSHLLYQLSYRSFFTGSRPAICESFSGEAGLYQLSLRLPLWQAENSQSDGQLLTQQIDQRLQSAAEPDFTTRSRTDGSLV